MYEISDRAIDRFYGEYERPSYGRSSWDDDDWDDEYEEESYYYDDELDEDLDAIEAISACEELGL